MSRRACAALLLLACSEGPSGAPPTDAAVADVARFPVGAPCTDDRQCAGACLRDLRDPAMGQRCFPPCDDGCPPGEMCVAGERGQACVSVDEPQAGAGESCAQSRCASGLGCTAAHPAGPTCAPFCSADADCAAPDRCPVETVRPRVCLPPDSAAFQCGVLGCERGDLVCVTEGAESRCLAPCGDVGEDCPSGGRCAREGQGGGVCRPTGDRALGESCASGGQAACAAELTCFQRGPGDPEAICSRACARGADCCPGCESEYFCRARDDVAICLPAPFGVGAERGEPGDDCAEHGLSDCRPGLLCVTGVAHQRVCAAPCDAGCDCVTRPEGEVCWPGEPGGVGWPCPTRSECADIICVGDTPNSNYCTRPCGDGCPPGYGCDGNLCLLGLEARPLGADCADGGAQACASGVCVATPAGAQLCSQPCDGDCPAGFDCTDLDGLGFCLPPGA